MSYDNIFYVNYRILENVWYQRFKNMCDLHGIQILYIVDLSTFLCVIVIYLHIFFA